MGRLSLAASSTPGAERRLLFPFRVWAERSAQRSNAAAPVVTARESRHPPATALTFSALADLIRRLFMFCSLTASISSRREEEEGRGEAQLRQLIERTSKSHATEPGLPVWKTPASQARCRASSQRRSRDSPVCTDFVLLKASESRGGRSLPPLFGEEAAGQAWHKKYCVNSYGALFSFLSA